MRIQKFIALAAVGMGTLVGADAIAASASASSENFLTKAISNSQFEVESSKLALEKSQNKDVKQYAQMMIESQTKILNTLTTYKQSTMGAAQKDMDKAHQDMMKKLEPLVTDNFNNEYSRMQQDTDKEMVVLFSEYAEKGDNADLRNFAAGALPQLKENKAQADKLDTNSH
ncbi:MAG TPA: DUF4142 domain-containing protein [Rickettsiales bacterium]|nr:DUF4142 domain-containing protein [Rickettsiales bacterium]